MKVHAARKGWYRANNDGTYLVLVVTFADGVQIKILKTKSLLRIKKEVSFHASWSYSVDLGKKIFEFQRQWLQNLKWDKGKKAARQNQ